MLIVSYRERGFAPSLPLSGSGQLSPAADAVQSSAKPTYDPATYGGYTSYYEREIGAIRVDSSSESGEGDGDGAAAALSFLHHHQQQPELTSQLDTEAVDGLALIRRLTRALHQQQHPPKESCKSRRLLVTQFSPKSFEGIGSIVKSLVHGLAVAAHANRTLIWGLDLPYVFEHSRQAWYGNDTDHPLAVDEEPFRQVAAAGLQLECSGW